MQYIVSPENKEKREELYDYLDKNDYYFPCGEKEDYINSNFPFVIEDHRAWICDSITCCACAAQAGGIITTEEFFKAISH